MKELFPFSYMIILEAGQVYLDGVYNRDRNNAWSSDMSECVCHLIGHKFSQFQALPSDFVNK